MSTKKANRRKWAYKCWAVGNLFGPTSSKYVNSLWNSIIYTNKKFELMLQKGRGKKLIDWCTRASQNFPSTKISAFWNHTPIPARTCIDQNCNFILKYKIFAFRVLQLYADWQRKSDIDRQFRQIRLSNYFFSKKKKISLVLENNYLISLKPIWLLQPSVKVMGQNKIVTPARL